MLLNRGRKGLGTDSSSLTPVDVILSIGESNTAGARNTMTELPNGFYTTDSNAYIFDDADLLGSGQALRVLKAPSYSTVTITIASPGVVSWTAHGLANGDPVVLTTTGALPTGLTAGTRYYVVNQATNTFQVAATRGGSAINTSGSQSGTHTAVANGGLEQQPGGSAYVDTAYQSTVGAAYALIARYRARNPSSQLILFNSCQGGGRFSDLSGRGRAANYKETLSDGAYNEVKVSWAALVSVLSAAGKTPNIVACRINLGGNSGLNSTETTNFDTDLTAFIAQLRTDIIGNAKVILDRQGIQLTAITNLTSIRAKQLTVASADPTRVELMDMDGGKAEAVDSIHYTAPAQNLLGQRLFAHASGLWHPAKPLLAAGDPIYPLRQWQFGGANSTISSGALGSTYDTIANAQTLSGAGGGGAPTVATRTLASGLVARFATWDASNDYCLGSSPFLINNSGGFIMGMAVKMAATNNVAIIGEAHDTQTNQFWALKSNTGGNPCITIRDDAGTLALSLVSLGGVPFDNTWHTLILTWTGSVFTAYTDGVVGGSPQTITKGTMTLQNITLGAQKVGGSVSAFAPLNCGEMVAMQYSSTGLAGVVANLHSYLSREYVA